MFLYSQGSLSRRNNPFLACWKIFPVQNLSLQPNPFQLPNTPPHYPPTQPLPIPHLNINYL